MEEHPRAMAAAEVPFRILPELTPRNRHFWTGGERGELCFLRCNPCGKWIHPPQPLCPACHSKDLAPRAVSGHATLHTFSINHQPWMPGPEVPFVVGIVTLEEDPSVRLTTNVVGCRPEDVRIGMPLRVRFEHHADPQGDVWLPLFEPDPTRRS
jgi:uncharacterized OB-fold protein